MSQQAVSADVIPNSAVWAHPSRAARVQHMIQLYATTAVQTGFSGFYLPLYLVVFYSAFLWSGYAVQKLFE
jgi:hypothetical protein